ncbi:hypothetical protein GOV03_03985 [Candidatus Woesearchaeota archaeon]|nr:hypothetical protein [Candidatus Woesearchaeota archaeon]
MSTTFYDNNGNAVAYTEDGEHIFLFNGKASAFISQNSIHSYSGKHLGWFEDGWIRDHSGLCVFFTENTMGSGPVKPVRSVKPVKSVKQVRPVKGVKHISQVRPVKSMGWSNQSGEQFFQ